VWCRVVAFADFVPVSASEAGEKNGRERVEGGPGRCHRPDAEVRRLPQESPRTRGSRRDRARKNPNRERLGFHYWWRRRESNPRPQVLYSQDYMLSLVFWVSPRARRPAGWRSASRFDVCTRPSYQTARKS